MAEDGIKEFGLALVWQSINEYIDWEKRSRSFCEAVEADLSAAPWRKHKAKNLRQSYEITVKFLEEKNLQKWFDVVGLELNAAMIVRGVRERDQEGKKLVYTSLKREWVNIL